MTLIRLSRLQRRLLSVTLCLLAGLGLLWAAGAFLHSAPQPGTDAKLELHPGDHVCLIGNTLPDRMQHDGWLETLFHNRFPAHELVFRNLGFRQCGVG